MKRLLIIICMVGLLGCATTQPKPIDQAQQYEMSPSVSVPGDDVMKALDAILDIGFTAIVWSMIH